jgi:hypothetical protein
VKPGDLVWRDGFGDWVPASKVKSLFDDGGGASAGVGSPKPAAPAGGVLPGIPARPTASGSPYAAAARPAPVVNPAAFAPAAAYPAGAPTSAYQPPGVLPYQGGGAATYGALVSPTAVELLRQTRPWVLLFSVLMFIMAGVTFLVGIVMMFAGMFARSPRAGGNAAYNTGYNVGSSLGSMCVGMIPIVFGLLYFFPALHLARYASRIGSLIASSRAEDLENALDAQKSFWRFIGILTVVAIVLYLLMILIVVVVAGAAVGAAGRGGRGF